MRKDFTRTIRPLRLLEKREHRADLAQLCGGREAERRNHALRRAEQVAEHRPPRATRLFEESPRSARAQTAPAERRHLELRIDGEGNPLQFPAALEDVQELAQARIAHRSLRLREIKIDA